MLSVKKKFCIQDLIAVLVILAIFLAFVFFVNSGKEGRTFSVYTDEGRTDYSLFEDRTLRISSRGYNLVITVSDGEVFFESSDCPDKICVSTGRLSRASQSAVCLPAGVTLIINSEESEDADWIIK